MTETESILNTLRELSDYFKDRLDYDMQGDPPSYVGNEEAHLYGQVQEAIGELGREPFNPDWSMLEQCRENLREQWKVNRALVEALQSLYDAMIKYQWDVEAHAPREHREMMDRARDALAAYEAQP